MSIEDLISEGSVGLIKAVDHFDPEKGYALTTCARPWIKSEILKYARCSRLLVQISSGTNQKKLFFKLLGEKTRIGVFHCNDMEPDQVKIIAERLGVKEPKVVEINRRLGGDVSLNETVSADGEEVSEYIDLLTDGDHQNQESRLELENCREVLSQKLDLLDDRERRIFIARNLADDKITLKKLAVEFGISCERVRQIEKCAFDKMGLSHLFEERKDKVERRPVRKKQKVVHAISRLLTPEEWAKVEQLRKRKAPASYGPCCTYTPEEWAAVKELWKHESPATSGPCRVYAPEQCAEDEQRMRSQGRLPNVTESELKAYKESKARLANEKEQAAVWMNDILHQSIERPKPLMFEVGEQVRVSDGPFVAFEGAVEEVDEARSRVKVAVPILGHVTPVEFEFGQIEKCEQLKAWKPREALLTQTTKKGAAK